MTQRFILLISMLLLWSCNQWETKKIPSETFLAESWKAIDINEVDSYPTFPNCDSIETKAALKACFENEITTAFYKSLQAQQLVVTSSLEDTVWIDLKVNQEGKLCIDSLHITDAVSFEIPDFPAYIHDAAQQLPKAFPATKRGIPVKTKFKLPVIVKVE